MKRLVYSPQINVWIKTDEGVFDLSPYVTGFTVNRKVNAISSAEVIFRNPKVDLENGESRFLFTQHKIGDHYGPMFHPMDPIIITLTRIKGYPVQVFTGYCDTVPYVQMFPGTAQIKASCTLKRLQYTYWDPGLPFVITYLSSKGWALQNGAAINLNAESSPGGTLNDSSIGQLLFDVLKDIGGWDKNDIFIQDLPSDQITAIVNGLYADLTKEAKASFNQMKEFLKKTINAKTVSSTDGGSGGGGGTPNTNTNDTSGPNGTLGGPFPVGQEKVITATTFYRGPDMGGAFKHNGLHTPDGTIPGGEYPGTTPNRGHWFGEPSVNPDAVDGRAMGGLPGGTPVKVTYKGKSIIVRKADIGAGGSTPINGHPDCMDIFEHGARTLGLTPDVGGPGKDVVKVTVLNESMVKELRRTNQVIW